MANAEQLRSKLTGYSATRHDFDFLAGSWHIKNRRLKHRNVGTDEWDEFDCPAREFKGMSMRTLDLETYQWSIYWINSQFGKLLNPVIGGFNGTHGLFYGDDEDAGVSVICQFEWLVHPSTPTWKQSFSWDGGATWEVNWVMEFTKINSAMEQQ